MRPQTAVIYMSIGGKSVLVAFQDLIQLSVEGPTWAAAVWDGGGQNDWTFNDFSRIQQDTVRFSGTFHYWHQGCHCYDAITVCRSKGCGERCSPKSEHSGHTHNEQPIQDALWFRAQVKTIAHGQVQWTVWVQNPKTWGRFEISHVYVQLWLIMYTHTHIYICTCK